MEGTGRKWSFFPDFSLGDEMDIKSVIRAIEEFHTVFRTFTEDCRQTRKGILFWKNVSAHLNVCRWWKWQCVFLNIHKTFFFFYLGLVDYLLIFLKCCLLFFPLSSRQYSKQSVMERTAKPNTINCTWFLMCIKNQNSSWLEFCQTLFFVFVMKQNPCNSFWLKCHCIVHFLLQNFSLMQTALNSIGSLNSFSFSHLDYGRWELLLM